MLTTILGKKGSGKTLLTTVFSDYSYKPNVYANYTMKIAKVKPLLLSTILEVSFSADLMIDECYIWLESRTSGAKVNIFLSQILMQSRKRGIDFYLTAQLGSMIDVRFRSESDYAILCYKWMDGEKVIGFEYNVIDREGNESFFFLEGLIANPFYDLYDTYEIVPPHNIKQLEYSVMSPQEQYSLAETIAVIIYPRLRGQITHDRVRREVKKLDYPQSELARDVYIECKDFQSDGKKKKIANLKFMKQKK